MNKIFIISIGIVLLFLFSFIAGYYLHEAKDQKEIQIEAYKLYQDNMNISKNKFIEKFNISTCGDLNGR